MPDRHKLVTGLVAMLGDVTGRDVYDSDVPGKPPALFHVVEEIPGGTAGGSWGEPQEQMTVVVQVASVGERRDQASAAGDQVWSAVFARTGGRFVHPIEGVNVIARDLDSMGGTERSGDRWQRVDRYALTIM